MSLPFYVSPEQVMQDKAEYARKGVGRRKSSLTLDYEDGMLLMAENTSSLSKIGELYDRIAFAGVGKFSEFDLGVRYADMKGYSYSRDDVRATGLRAAACPAPGNAQGRPSDPSIPASPPRGGNRIPLARGYLRAPRQTRGARPCAKRGSRASTWTATR